MTINSFIDANKHLARFYQNTRSTTNYTLYNMRKLMAHLGNPQECYRVLHVAGTSGKTSTAYYAAALLRQAGYKTGLTVSPHVDEINERVQINGQPLSETEFCRALAEFLELIESVPVKPSWFEVMVAFAYWYFAVTEVDCAVVEVGLGGLKDGTNVIERPDKVCIITDIGLDHTQILGHSLAEIAAQKAGIIHPGNHVFIYRQSPIVVSVVKSAAIAQEASLKLVTPVQATSDLPLFQQRNFYLALQAVKYIVKRDNHSQLDEQQLSKVQGQTYIPGRMEIVHYKGKMVILDGAHNAQKLQTLIDSLRVKYADKTVVVLAGFVEGDETRLDGALEAISHLSKSLMLTSFLTAKDFIKQSADLDLMAEIARRHGIKTTIEPDVGRAFAKSIESPADIVLVTGSFYLLNHIRPLMLKT